MRPRRIVLYGTFPQQVAASLTSQYSAHILLNTERIDRSIAQALQTLEYDVAVVADTAPHALLFERAMGEHSSRPKVITVRPGLGAKSVVAQIVAEAGWGAGLHTVFVVVTALKGGVGKSTLTAVLAHVLAEEGHQILGVDDNPTQGNLIDFFHPSHYDKMPLEVMRTADQDALRSYMLPIDAGLTLLPPEDYGSTGGLTLASANGFWGAVAGMGYDLVLVDTTPSFATPTADGTFVEAPLTYALIRQTEMPAIFVVPFTPDDWAHQGLSASRSLLAQHGHEDHMLTVATAIDAAHVLENVPDWVLKLRDEERFFAVPHNRAIRDNPQRSMLKRSFLRHPTGPYEPIARRVVKMADVLRRATL
jgi:hypothetical protein